jgi:hypothetical protein
VTRLPDWFWGASILALVVGFICLLFWQSDRVVCVWSPKPDREDIRLCATARDVHYCMQVLGYDWQCSVPE